MAGLGRKVWANEVLSQPDLQGYLQDQVMMRFPNAAARAAAIPAPTEGMFSTLDDTDTTERADAAGVWRRVGVGAWVDVVNNVAFSYNIPISGTGQLITGCDTGAVTIPDGKSMDIEFAVPSGSCSASASSNIRMLTGTGVILTGQTMSTGGAQGHAWGVYLHGTVLGPGTTNVLMQSWASSGTTQLQGNAAGAIPVRYRYRIL